MESTASPPDDAALDPVWSQEFGPFIGARAVTAHHEAGHAVAYVMRGGSELRSVSITPHPRGRHLGITHGRAHGWDQPFINYAGPWAEARYAWSIRNGDLPLDEDDQEGTVFVDYAFKA